MAQIGSIIEDKYEILKQIGRGGMSKVYLAMDQRLNKQWAVKEIEKSAGDKKSEIVVQSLVAEANLMKKLDHPALPRIVDIIDYPDTILVIMDYIEGEPLSRLLLEEGAQPQEKVIGWAKQICHVLGYLHGLDPPIIYRDMKPANVMLQPGGNIKLIDFGIAREYKAGRATDTLNLGTKGYAAPEQFCHGEQTDERTDIYSLGVTLYHLVTGKDPAEEPYELYPIRYWNSSLSGGLENIIEKCTRQNPRSRYQNCGELLYALNHYEEMDDQFRLAERRKIRFFIGALLGASFFLLLGIGTSTAAYAANNARYETKWNQAKRIASRKEEKAGLLLEAIGIKPQSMEAYEELIDTYKEDSAFTVQEEGQLVKCLNQNLDILRKQKQYAKLAFDIGKLYWYYYDYGTEESGDNRATRIRNAAKWFEDALETCDKTFPQRNMAKIYMEIGNFQNTIATAVVEASDQGSYRRYWTNIEKMEKAMEKEENESEIVRLELCKLIIDSIESYSRKLKDDGIRRERLEDAVSFVGKEITKIDSTTDKTEALKMEIQSRYPEARKAIENAWTASQPSVQKRNSWAAPRLASES